MTLNIASLKVSVAGKEILKGVDLSVGPSEVHAVMGPNGAGKSTLSNTLMGKSGYEVTAGEVTLDGVDLLSLPTWKRAQAGLFLAMQYPVEVPGVSLAEMLENAFNSASKPVQGLRSQLADEAQLIGLNASLLERPLNVDMSGGEKKRNETVQLAVLKPKFAVIDELDSGLDLDGLKLVASRVMQAAQAEGLGVLVITHYKRMLQYLKPDRVHVLANGQILESGGPELADRLEETGYGEYALGSA